MGVARRGGVAGGMAGAERRRGVLLLYRIWLGWYLLWTWPCGGGEGGAGAGEEEVGNMVKISRSDVN